jgi:hemolysin activation/secretion protein
MVLASQRRLYAGTSVSNSMPPTTRSARFAFAVCVLALANAAPAQVPVPDAGAILRETDPAQRSAPATSTLGAPAASPITRAREGTLVKISSVRITGATRYDEAELHALVAHLIGREVDYLELRQAADKISQRYRADGWFARAYLPEQSLDDGVLTIAVIEAHVGAVRIEAPAAGTLVGEGTIRRMLLAGQHEGETLEIVALERAALLVDELPGIAVAVVLAPGEQAGATDIIARVENSRRWLANVEADNSGIPSTGRERTTGQLLLESPLGRGDELAALLNFSRGNRFARLSYELPAGSGGWRVGASAATLEYELGGAFKALDAHGRATTWGMSASYPLMRSNRFNARFTSVVEERRYANFAFGLETSSSFVRAARAGLMFDRLDAFGGGGLLQYGLQVTYGALDLSDNAQDFAVDAATTRSDGHYSKISWNAARLQRLGERDRLLLSVSGQNASRNLDSSEQLSLGGSSGVRAYPELEATGDQGWTATVEWTHTFAQHWSAALFHDWGSIWQHKRAWTGWNDGRADLRNRYSLDGVGVSVAWSGFSGFEVRATAATRFGGNPGADPVTGNDGDGARHEPQVWVNVRWHL